MLFLVISLLIGMVLGRLKVLVMAPSIALALTVTIAAGFVRAETLGQIVLFSVAVIANLQIGYLAGTVIYHYVANAASPLTGIH
jgi:hypothetical protein